MGWGFQTETWELSERFFFLFFFYKIIIFRAVKVNMLILMKYLKENIKTLCYSIMIVPKPVI